jgi:hypothetical protein
MTQLRAIEILLRKCIPDLAAAKIKSEQTRRYVVEVSPVLDREEWQRKYGRTRACHRRAYSNLDAGQQSAAEEARVVHQPRAT